MLKTILLCDFSSASRSPVYAGALSNQVQIISTPLRRMDALEDFQRHFTLAVYRTDTFRKVDRDFLSEATAQNPHALVLVSQVKAPDSEMEEISAFEHGANDWVLEQGRSPETLNSRIRNLLNRASGYRLSYKGEELFCASVGEAALYPQKHSFFVNGQYIKLSSGETKLLKLLMETGRKFLTRAEMLECIDTTLEASEQSVDLCVKRIRRKLGMAGLKNDPIDTLVNKGYRINTDRKNWTTEIPVALDIAS